MTTAEERNPVWLIAGNPGGAAGPSPQEIGFKAYNLMRMARIRLPVPPALVLGVELCREVLAGGGDGLEALLRGHMRELEAATGQIFGSSRRPLLVSVRSGAAVSMPGMLETVLNIGLGDLTLRGLLRLTGNPRLAWDSYRRLVQTFAEVVQGCSPAPFEEALLRRLAGAGAETEQELDSTSLAGLTGEFLTLHDQLASQPFPQDPYQQLAAAVRAVFRSWNAPKALAFRRINGLEDLAGTAVTIQAMVFGNAGGTSGAGVGFTRDPATGENRLYGDFLFNAQGEDVVSGRSALGGKSDLEGELGRLLPAVAEEIRRAARLLESEFADMQDFEFTVQDGRLFLLQTRSGKRTPWAALKIAVDMVAEGLIGPQEALKRLDGLDLDHLERRCLEVPAGMSPLARAVPAGLGTAAGVIALSAERAVALAAAGQPVILVRRDIATSDIVGIKAAVGLLTALGGRTSHAAVVARQLDKVCLVGCAVLRFDADGRGITLGGRHFVEGDCLSLDGQAGTVYEGRLAVRCQRPEAELRQVALWRSEKILQLS